MVIGAVIKWSSSTVIELVNKEKLKILSRYSCEDWGVCAVSQAASNRGSGQVLTVSSLCLSQGWTLRELHLLLLSREEKIRVRSGWDCYSNTSSDNSKHLKTNKQKPSGCDVCSPECLIWEWTCLQWSVGHQRLQRRPLLSGEQRSICASVLR